MTPLLYKNRYKYGSGTRWRKIDRNRFTGEKIENSTFLTVIFQVPT
ncbi:QnrB43_1_AFA52643 [Klebsiella pneumoniae]|nr:QnrB43_1_AFA52643 [Klebsiella pneumoniae]